MSPHERRRVTVLIVDDDEAIRDALDDVVQAAGYPSVQAANGKQALDYLRGRVEPSIVLLDLMMPVVDGHEVLRCIAAEGLRARPIVLSASGAAATIPPGTRFLAKPVQRATLLAEIAAAERLVEHEAPPPAAWRAEVARRA